jgi:hypothetical protein
MGIKQLSPVPALAVIDLVTQAAAIVATLLYAVPATQPGLYDVAFALKVTRAATTSSTLGTLTISYTDATDSVVQTVIALGGTQAGAAATSNAGNSTTSVLQGRVTVNAKAGTNITYAIAYVSSGATTMQYEAHLSVRQA